MDKLLILGNLLLSGFLTGLIWFVQVVHYPIFAKVPEEGFSKFHHFHTAATGSIVAVPMLIELFLAFMLLFADLGKWQWIAWGGLALVGFIWLQTFLQFMPLHGKLSTSYQAKLIQQLVSANWWRTWAWTARFGLLAFLVWERFIK